MAAQALRLPAPNDDDDDDVVRDGDLFIVEIDGQRFEYPASLWKVHRDADKKGILNNLAPPGSAHRRAYDAVRQAKADGTIENKNKSPAATVKVEPQSPMTLSRPPTTGTRPRSNLMEPKANPANYTYGGRATALDTETVIIIKPENTTTIRQVTLSGSDTAAQVIKVEVGNSPVMVATQDDNSKALAPRVSDFSNTRIGAPWLAGLAVTNSSPLKITIKGSTTGNVLACMEHDPTNPATCITPS